MPDRATLRFNAMMRLDDAQALFDRQRYDGAAYICGYALEFALKARICETLNTLVYPDGIAGFKTHNLQTLLLLTGQESYLKQNALAEWTFVVQYWRPEMRYDPPETVSAVKVQTLLDAAKTLLTLL